MSSYTPIDCHLHDSIEVVCLYHYNLRIALHDGKAIEGIAQNWITDKNKVEYLILGGDSETRIRLDRIKRIDVLTPNARFTHIHF